MNKMEYVLLEIISILFLCITITGCGNRKTKMIFDHVPDPANIFSGDYDFQKYDDGKGLKGVTVSNIQPEDLNSLYDQYIENLNELNYWTIEVFDGEQSWCYQNKNGTLQIAVNIYEDTCKIDICIKELEVK